MNIRHGARLSVCSFAAVVWSRQALLVLLALLGGKSLLGCAAHGDEEGKAVASVASFEKPAIGMVTSSKSFNIPAGVWSCTGTIVAPRVVLTSNSCAREAKGYFHSILAPLNVASTQYRVAYRSRTHDVALLYLDKTNTGSIGIRSYVTSGKVAEWWSVGGDCGKGTGDFRTNGTSIVPASWCVAQGTGGPAILKEDGRIFGVVNKYGAIERLGDIWQEVNWAISDVTQGYQASTQTIRLNPKTDNARTQCFVPIEHYYCLEDEADRVRADCIATGVPAQEIEKETVNHWCKRPVTDLPGTKLYTNADQCKTPLPGTCQFYRECLDVDGIGKRCGFDGYALGFGEKYCYRFKNHTELSPDGNDWRNKTLDCLQRVLASNLHELRNMSCDEIACWAFFSHVECYTNFPSICWLPIPDQHAIGTSVDAADIAKWQSIATTGLVAKVCHDQLRPPQVPPPPPPPQPPCTTGASYSCPEGLQCVNGTCVPPHPPPTPGTPPPDPPPTPGVLKIMAVGDSITHGDGGDYTWRYRLRQHLVASGVAFDYVGPFNGPLSGSYAVQGWDDDHASKWGRLLHDEQHAIGSRVAMFEPDILLVHIGTNDIIYLGVPVQQMRTFIANARAAKPNVKFILAQIGDTQFMKDHQVAEYAAALERLAASESRPGSEVRLASVYPSFSWPTDTRDGTHLSARGELVVAKGFADSLSANFGIGRPYGPVPFFDPPAPTQVSVSPGRVALGSPFTVSWPRVSNPGIWTTYFVQVRTHRDFGYQLLWQSKETSDLSVTYDGPRLPHAGIYHVAVVAFDGTYKSHSAPVQLEVTDSVTPTGVSLQPSLIGLTQPFTVSWPRVTNPGVWTWYTVELRTHSNFGNQLLWESATTTDLSMTYYGPRLPFAGIYNVYVVAHDGTYNYRSAPIDLAVTGVVGPPKPTGVTLSPSTVNPSQRFTVNWPRVNYPGVWTTYTVELHEHLNYGFRKLWESAPTPDLTATYDGPPLQTAGVYHVVVQAFDNTYKTMSDPVALTVNGNVGPPAPTGIVLWPNPIPVGSQFVVSWPRVNNPGVWTTYRVELRNHRDFGFALLWRSDETFETSLLYGGPALSNGIYHVVVTSFDGTHTTMSEPVALEVFPDAAP